MSGTRLVAALAAESVPAFLPEIVGLLVATALVAYVCHKIRVMPIVSFLLTGALIGPHALGLVRDEGLIEAAAELGVVLLLFTIGLEFSLEKLARIKRLIFVGGGLQVTLVVLLVMGLLAGAGIDWRTGLYTGCLVALSSTAIVMKLLMTRGETNTTGGQAALGILIFQDLAVVAMVLLVPMLAGVGTSGLAVPLALGKAIVIVTLVVAVARRVMPKVLEAVARTCSQEIFLLTVVAICLGTAYLTSLAGVSLSLGAFLAGLVVSESRFSHMAFGEILPLQILFSATFFVSVGLLLDLRFLVSNPLLVVAAIGGSLVIKVLATGVSLKVLGIATGTTAFTSLLLAQVGEFSFVLERTGRELGLYPAGIEIGGPEAFVAATVIMMIATPPISRLCDQILARSTRKSKGDEGGATPVETGEVAAPSTELRDHVIIAGYGDGGRELASALSERAIPYLVLTLSPEGAREAEGTAVHVLRGNYTRQHELTLAGARQARLLVVADDDLETTHRVVAAAHALNPDLTVMARTRFASEIQQLAEAGAAEVVAEEREGVVRLLGRVLAAYQVDDATIQRRQDALRRGGSTPMMQSTAVRLSDEQQASDRCAHLGTVRSVTPSAAGCEECLASGSAWVHLRICMACGHVGCCENSVHKHAQQHSRERHHPIIKSFEPGEDWAWCYEEETYL